MMQAQNPRRFGDGAARDRIRLIVNTIAAERIYSHLAYRPITTIYSIWKSTGVYQWDPKT